jgi:hypothetical protein
MSYSFSVKSATKDGAYNAAVQKVEETVAQQQSHGRDKDQILANLKAVVSLLDDDETKDVVISCNGYISSHGRLDTDPLCSAAISCSAGLVPRA